MFDESVQIKTGEETNGDSCGHDQHGPHQNSHNYPHRGYTVVGRLLTELPAQLPCLVPLGNQRLHSDTVKCPWLQLGQDLRAVPGVHLSRLQTHKHSKGELGEQ